MSLPEGGPFRYEIIIGELCMPRSPNTRHQEISGNLFEIIRDFLRASPVGKIFPTPRRGLFQKSSSCGRTGLGLCLEGAFVPT